jgi:hypothetical protein
LVVYKGQLEDHNQNKQTEEEDKVVKDANNPLRKCALYVLAPAFLLIAILPHISLVDWAAKVLLTS